MEWNKETENVLKKRVNPNDMIINHNYIVVIITIIISLLFAQCNRNKPSVPIIIPSSDCSFDCSNKPIGKEKKEVKLCQIALK